MKAILILVLSLLQSRHNALHVAGETHLGISTPVTSYEVGAALANIKNNQNCRDLEWLSGLKRLQREAKKATEVQKGCCVLVDPVYGSCGIR